MKEGGRVKEGYTWVTVKTRDTKVILIDTSPVRHQRTYNED